MTGIMCTNDWVFNFLPLMCMSVFVPVPYDSYCCRSVMYLRPEMVLSPAFFFLLSTVLGIWGLLWLHILFKTIFFSSVKRKIGILIDIELNLPDICNSFC